jgi:CRISPR-associated protein Csx10
MTTLYVSLEAISPLAVRSDHAASRTGSSEYIPGNTLLGSLATVHRVLRQERENEFERLFLRGETLYSNLYPATFETSDESLQESRPVYPLPKTAQSCKRHKGFPPLEGETGDGHGVRDSLADWAVFGLGEKNTSFNRLAALTLDEHKWCKVKGCHELLDHYNGYYRRSSVDPERMVKATNSSRLQTHTGIDRESGTVHEGILYSRQVFEEGSKFWGEIRLPNDEELIASFLDFLERVNKSHLLRLGTGRTRGMGKVKIEFEEANSSSNSYTEFDERVRKLNGFIHEQLTAAIRETQAEQFKDKFFFALTLHSPAILTDEFLRYYTRIDADVLCELLDIDKTSYSLENIYTITSTRRVTGWQELWGTPRTNEYAIETGSVFLFQCNVNMREKLIDKLFALEQQGMGKRRAEGFGRICISDPFHLRGEQK